MYGCPGKVFSRAGNPSIGYLGITVIHSPSCTECEVCVSALAVHIKSQDLLSTESRLLGIEACKADNDRTSSSRP